MAAWALGEIGPAAKPAIPALVRLSKRKETTSILGGTQCYYVCALGKIDVDAVPIRDFFRDKEQALESSVAVGAIGPRVLPILVQLLRDKDPNIRQRGADALVQMDAKACAGGSRRDRAGQGRKCGSARVGGWGSWKNRTWRQNSNPRFDRIAQRQGWQGSCIRRWSAWRIGARFASCAYRPRGGSERL